MRLKLMINLKRNKVRKSSSDDEENKLPNESTKKLIKNNGTNKNENNDNKKIKYEDQPECEGTVQILDNYLVVDQEEDEFILKNASDKFKDSK